MTTAVALRHPRPVLTLVEAATEFPLELDEAKIHLRIDHSDSDAELQAYIDTAIALVDGPDGMLYRAICTQTWQEAVSGYDVTGSVWLSLPPVQTVTAISYIDSDGQTQTAELADFELVRVGRDGAYVQPVSGKAWPVAAARPDALRVTYTTGLEVAEVPPQIVTAIKLLAGHLYENRSASLDIKLHELPMGVSALLSAFKTKAFAG